MLISFSVITLVLAIGYNFYCVFDNTVVFDTLPYSHYAEQTRWLLDICGLKYKETTSVPIIGILLGGRTVPTLKIGGRTTLGDTEIIKNYLKGKYPAIFEQLYNKEHLEEITKLEDRLHNNFGLHARRYCYSQILPHKESACKILVPDCIPFYQAIWVKYLGGFELIRFFLKNRLKIDEKSGQKSLEITQQAFADFDEMLQNKEYLVGDSFTICDLVPINNEALASLGSIVVPSLIQSEFGGKVSEVACLYNIDDIISANTREQLHLFENSTTGKHIQKVYKEFRTTVMLNPEETD